MNKKYKWLSAGLSTLLLLSMVGCATASPAATQTPSVATQASSAASADTTAPAATAAADPDSLDALKATADDAVITVTYKDYQTANCEATTADNGLQSVLGKWMLDNFKMKFEQLPTGGQPMEELTRDIASNMLPNMLRFWIAPDNASAFNLLKKSVSEGVFADLQPSIDKYAPTIKAVMDPANLKAYYNATMRDPDFGGKLYMLPTWHTQGADELGEGLYIRGDVAKSMNLTLPKGYFKSTDEFISYLTAIKTAGVKDAGGKAAYPLGLYKDRIYLLNSAFDFGGTAGVGIKDGKVAGWDETDYPVQQIAFHRALLKGGLIDPESYTQDSQITDEKMAAGRYAVTEFYPGFPTFASIGKEVLDHPGNNPDWAFQLLGRMENHNGDTFATLNTGVAWSPVLLAGKDAPVDRLVKALEFYNTNEGIVTAKMGPESAGYRVKTADGYYKFTDDVYNNFYAAGKGSDFEKTLFGGMWLNFSTIVALDDSTHEPFGKGSTQNPTFLNDPKSITNLEKHNDLVKGSYGDVKLENGYTLDMAASGFTGLDKVHQILDNQEDTLRRCYLSKTDAEATQIWNDYVTQLKANGYDDYLAYIQKQYDANPTNFVDYVTPY
jgi:hypothetical protein